MKRRIAFALVLLLLLSTCGCKEESLQRVMLTITEDENAFEHFPAEYFQGNSDSFLRYSGISSVEITLGRKTYPLEEAILSGLVATEEIRAWASIDERNGICRLETHSRNGLSHFIYRYPDLCDLYFCQDVYETPDGKQHIFSQFAIYPYNEAPEIYFIDAYEDENGDKHNLDEENWGLTFEIQNLSPTGFDLMIMQRSSFNRAYRSQQNGQLKLNYFSIIPLMDPVPESIENLFIQTYKPDPQVSMIPSNADATIPVVFADLEGVPKSLPSGRYKLIVEIADEFDENLLHPLTRDYHRYQKYYIYFEIS